MIFDGAHDDRILFAALEFMHSRDVDRRSDLLLQCIDLCVVRSYDANMFGFVRKRWQYFFADDVDFTLVYMVAVVIALDRFNGANDIWFTVIAGHDNEVAAVEFPVTKVDDFRMTAIVLFQQGLWNAGNRAADGFQKTVSGAVVGLGDGELYGDFVELEPCFRCNDIR